MKSIMLQIKNLHTAIEDGTEILKGLNLTVCPGETHVIVGPNGAGKSTLAHTIMGSPNYQITDGSLCFEEEDITEASTDKRAKKGIFLSFQSPEEVDGITVEHFLRTAKSAVTEKPVRAFAFRVELEDAMKSLQFDSSYSKRYLNVGFSGGEKKKNEILQMLLLNPKLAILDETDSGLDVDAVKTVTEGVNQFKSEDNALMIISHNTKLLENLAVDYVHVLVDGRLVCTGGRELIDAISRDGFTQFTGSREL